jgi:hypothetical protein
VVALTDDEGRTGTPSRNPQTGVVAMASRAESAAVAIDLIETLVEALERIRQMTDPNDPGSYRNDDREGCLETVHACSTAALAKARGDQ